MVDNGRALENIDFKDRKPGLVLFGILQIMFGVFCMFSIPLMIFGIIAAKAIDSSSGPSITTGNMVLSAILYLLLAVWFIWMGIGSILARRWVRALILLFSWVWLICGICGFMLMLFIMPDMYGSMAMRGDMPEEVLNAIKYITTGFMAVVFVILPGVFVLFYGSKNVKMTCELRDPKVRWTDKRPLPVLALSSLFGTAAISMLSFALYNWAVPFFGFIVSGIAGAVIVLVYIVLCTYAAWGIYKVRITAWWCGVLLTITSAVSIGITFSRVSLLDFYAKTNLPQQDLDILKEFGILQDSTAFLIFWGIVLVGLVGFLLYTKRYFAASA